MPLPEILARVRRLGFSGVELLGDLENLTTTAVRNLLIQEDLAVYSLTPANVDLAHPEPAVRGVALDYYRRLLDFAAELGGPKVSCHGAMGRVAPHMNIEEPSPAAAILEVGPHLGLFHLADSNRLGLGHGHTDFAALLGALRQVDYRGPLILFVKPGNYTPLI
ncbi:sugar phosphate isomerase/epimerase [Meiothermus sp. QL-1]|nr:sugar phosphate isomerase/epimerase [Meiothermus sp. QL-1]